MYRLIKKEQAKVTRQIESLEEEHNGSAVSVENLRSNELTNNCFEDQEILSETSVIENITALIVKSRLSRKTCNPILKIFIKAKVDVLPNYEALFKDQLTNTRIVSVPPGQYFHYGIEKSLHLLNFSNFASSSIMLDIGIDGIPLYKRSKTQLWPIVASVSNYNEIKPFRIGAYIGTSKC